MPKELILDANEVTSYLDEVFPQAKRYDWSIVELCNGAITVLLRVKKEDLRPGDTISGPTMMALADLSAYMVILAHIGKLSLAVTTNLNINFLRKPEGTEIIAKSSIIKLGKRLAVCEISIFSADKTTLVAHAIATYSIPVAS